MEIVADEPYKIEWLRLLYLKRGLYLEINTGMKSRGGSAYKALKEELGIKGNRQKVLDQVNQMIQSMKEQQQGEA
tara:strand:- start:417 stop:641 length:225 start_codon:yes stop_codon:yes gene_type:complete